uniref:Secreted protein n=1 Tax=Ixodes ricinus TaxID=34613 RepID=A0A6B0U3K2_IXORI
MARFSPIRNRSTLMWLFMRLVCQIVVMSSNSCFVGFPVTETKVISIFPFLLIFKIFSGFDGSRLLRSIFGGGLKCSGSSSGSSGSSSSSH